MDEGHGLFAGPTAMREGERDGSIPALPDHREG